MRLSAVLVCALMAACAARSQCAALPEAPHGLQNFYNSLSDLKAGQRKQVSILHLGDSHIARDGMTALLRHRWHDMSGDAGRGLPPGVPYRYYAPEGYSIDMQGAWDVASSHDRDAEGIFGVQGFRVSSQNPAAFMSLEMPEGEAIDMVGIDVLAAPDGGTLLLALDDAAPLHLSTKAASSGLLHLTVPAHAARRIRLSPAGDGMVTLLGWAMLTGKSGIRYDSYGISGVTLDVTSRWDADVVAQQIRTMQPDLIILGYGTNEGFDDALNLTVYGRHLAELLTRLRAAAPQASLAVLGAMDGARKVESGGNCGGTWQTPPKLDPLREIQMRVAQAEGAFYFDLSQSMGRPCGMDQWVRAEPPLAYADHVHLREAGGARVAATLWQALMGPYERACPAD